jgi:hypothetical protein
MTSVTLFLFDSPAAERWVLERTMLRVFSSFAATNV